MIDPRWLEGAFIAYNDAINYDDNPAEEARRKIVDTNIHVSRYRDFVGQNPDKVTYFQPILDTLQYAPSWLELGREAIFEEGKNDFYAFSYFARIFGFENKCRFMPGTGAGGLAPLISMYLGWGTKFLILLDDDKAGKNAREKYRADYILDNSRVVCLSELISTMAGLALEGLLSPEGRKIIEHVLGCSATKKDIGRFFQEKIATDQFVQFDKKTLDDFKLVLDGCAAKLAN